MRSIFHYHVASTKFADLIRYLIFDLHFLKIFFRLFHCFFQVRIEIADNRLPVDYTLFHFIKQGLHVGCEIRLHNTWECLFHNMIYHFPKLSQIQISSFFCHITTGNNRTDGRCISTGASNAKFFQRLNQCSLCIMGRRLCEMLFVLKFQKLKL